MPSGKKKKKYVEIPSDYGDFSNFSLQFCFTHSEIILFTAPIFRTSVSSWRRERWILMCDLPLRFTVLCPYSVTSGPAGASLRLSSKESACSTGGAETRLCSLSWEEPLEEGMATHSSILPGESHGQSNLEGESP